MTMEIEYVETEKFSEIIPKSLLEDDLILKIGKTAILQWFLVEPFKRNFENQDGAFYQEIFINILEKFSEKLNSTFFINIANEFKFNNKLGKKYKLIFKLMPKEDLKQKSRISWWDANIVCFELESGNWKIKNNKVLEVNEIYGNILKRGEIKFKNGI
jgi:hypothetical protein